MAENKPPVRKYRSGALQLSVWENQGAEDRTFESFTFERSYQDKDGNWQKTTALRVSDLPRLTAMLNQAYVESTVKTE